MISFGRPTMPATEAAFRSGYQQPKKLATVVNSMLDMEGARQTFSAMAASEMGIDREELEKRYSKYDQDNTMLFPIPPSWAAKMNNGEGMEIGASGIERPFAVKIPIPPLLRLWAAPLKGVAKAYKTGNPAHAISGGLLGVADEALPGSVPLDTESLGGLGRSVGQRALSVLPAPYRLPIEQYADVQGFTGAPIVGSRLKELPAEDQWSASTEPFYKDLGQAIGASPQRLQHLGKGMLPGLFQLPMQVYNQGAPAPRSPEGELIPAVEQSPFERLNQIPILGDFTKRITPQRYEEELSEAQDKFYGLSDQAKSAATTVNDYDQGVSLKVPSERIQYMAAINPDVQALVRDLSEVSDEQKRVLNDPAMSPREKRDAMKELLTLRREALREFLSIPEVTQLIGGEVPAQ
jgi:hypothetical protein